jgi:hypothetical protein
VFPTFAPATEITPEFLLTIDHVCGADASSRSTLLGPLMPQFLSDHLIASTVPELANLSLLLLHHCMLASPELNVNFSPNQLFRWLSAKEQFAQTALSIACILIKYQPTVHQ